MNDMQYTRSIFADRLRKLRKSQGESQEKLSKILGITRASISLYETQETTPDISILAGIAEHYRVTTDYLLGLENTTTHENASLQEEIGLSEEAIEKLQFYKHNHPSYQYDLEGLNSLIVHNDAHRLLRGIHFYTMSFDLQEEDFNNEAIYRWYTQNTVLDFTPTIENTEFDDEKPIEELSHNDVYYYKINKSFENTLYALSKDTQIKEELIKRIFKLYQKRFGKLESIPEFGYIYTYIKNTFSFPIENYNKLSKPEKKQYVSYYHPFDITDKNVRDKISEFQQRYKDFLLHEQLSDDWRSADKFVTYICVIP